MFDQAVARFAGRFRRVEPRATARAYLFGLLSGVERKNCWQLAEQAGYARPGPMQRLLRTARWSADDVRDDVRAYVVEHLGADDGVSAATSSRPAPNHIALASTRARAAEQDAKVG